MAEGLQIGQLPKKENLTGNELIPFQQGSSNGSMSTATLKKYIGTGGGTGSTDYMNYITEYNVSVQHPTSGIDGSNKYSLEGAIAQVPQELRNIGLKVSFINSDGKVETWEYGGGTFTTIGNWVQGGGNKMEAISHREAVGRYENMLLSNIKFSRYATFKYSLITDYKSIKPFSRTPGLILDKKLYLCVYAPGMTSLEFGAWNPLNTGVTTIIRKTSVNENNSVFIQEFEAASDSCSAQFYLSIEGIQDSDEVYIGFAENSMSMIGEVNEYFGEHQGIIMYHNDDITTIANKKYDDNGELISAYSERCSELVEIPFECKMLISAQNSFRGLFFYDKNRKLLSKDTLATFATDTIYTREVLPPHGAKYFSVTRFKDWDLYIILVKYNSNCINNSIALPNEIYSLKNKELTIYLKSVNPNRIVLSQSIFSKNSEFFRMKITSDINNVIFNTITNKGQYGLRKDISIKCCVSTDGIPIKVCAVGDSITQMGEYVKWAYGLLQNVKFVSSFDKGSEYANEGRGGWSLGRYFVKSTKGITSCVGSLSPFIHPVSDGYYWGSTKEVKELFAGGDNMFKQAYQFVGFSKDGLKSNPGNGDVMLDNGNVVSSSGKYIKYNGSSWEETDIDTEAYFDFSIQKYIEAWDCDFDIITFMLGTNDANNNLFYSYDTITTDLMTNYEKIVNQVKELGKKIVIMLPTCSILDNLPSYFDPSIKLYSYYRLRMQLIEAFEGRTSEGVFLCDFGGAVDPIFGYNEPVTEKPFEEYSKEEDRSWGQTPPREDERVRMLNPNDVHPTYAGCRQGGTRYAGCIQYIREKFLMVN